MSTKRVSCEDCEIVSVDLRGVKRVKMDPPMTPPRGVCPPCPALRPRITLSRLLMGRAVEAIGAGTPVKLWPKGFWTARRNLYKESEVMGPATPVKICPAGPRPASPQDIFK